MEELSNSGEGRNVCLRLNSQVLSGNRLNDPATREVWVWLPPSYGKTTNRRYSVLYYLAGFTGRGKMALNDHPWSPGMDRRMGRLLQAGIAKEAILVFPDCFTRLGGSQYVNSSYMGFYEDYLVQEVVPLIDREFRTKGDGYRGVFGKSSGGFGALRLGMKYPGLFSAVASHAGDVSFDLCYLPDFPKAARGLKRAGGFKKFMDQFESKEKKTGDQIHVLNICAMSAAYSPLEDGSGFQFPFRGDGLELDEEVWAKWISFDPLEMLKLEKNRIALKSMKVLFLDAGTNDEWNLDFGAHRFSKVLSSHGIDHIHEEFEDGHMGTSYRFDRSLPLLTRALT